MDRQNQKTDRLLKIGLNTVVLFYLVIVCFNNITDYGSNFQFVSKVSSMEDVFSGEAQRWRSITSPVAHHVIFVSIILCELTMVALLARGVFAMTKNLNADAESFRLAKQPGKIALAMGVMLWFGVFIAAAGEWFLMWQSTTWNAQSTGFALTTIFLLFLVYHSKEE